MARRAKTLPTTAMPTQPVLETQSRWRSASLLGLGKGAGYRNTRAQPHRHAAVSTRSRAARNVADDHGIQN